MPRLTVEQRIQQAAKDSSAVPVADATQRLKEKHFPNARWLGVRNRYRIDTAERIKNDVRIGTRLKPKQLQEYVAASVVLHCADGWSFLSRAVESMLNGDSATAMHLAYYAELRAGMSFLASEGIGVFSRDHFWIDGSSNCLGIKGKPTHEMVWLALQEWAQIPARSSSLLNLFRVNGYTIAEWLDAAGYSSLNPTSRVLAKGWLEQWSLDLKDIAKDQYLRNEVSYRPQRLRATHSQTDVARTLEKLVDFWRACEPSEIDRFELLDRNLLRQALRKTYRLRTASRPEGPVFTSFVARTFSNLGLSQTGVFYDFVATASENDEHPILTEARKRVEPKHALLHTLSVVSRAILLLRMASAATDNLLQKSIVDRADLKFWWDALGRSAGFWEPDSEPDQLTDLWQDVQENLEVVESWLSGNSSVLYHK